MPQGKTYDIMMPDGTRIKDVPVSYTRAQVEQLYRNMDGTKSTIGPKIPFVAANPTVKSVEQRLYKWIPPAAAGAASLAVGPEGPLVYAALASAGGGAAGKLAEQALEGKLRSQTHAETLKQDALAGLTQGLAEVGGRDIAGPLISKMLKGSEIPGASLAGTDMSGRDISDIARRSGARITIPELKKSPMGLDIQGLSEMGIVGHKIGTKAKSQTESAISSFADQVANTISARSSPLASGTQVRDALWQANKAFKRQASDIWDNKLIALGKNAPADFTPLIEEAQKEYNAPPSLVIQRNIGKFGLKRETPLPDAPQVPGLLGNIMSLKPEGNFADGITIKNYLDRFTGPSNTILADPGSQRIARLLRKRLMEVMDSSADEAGGPLKEQWKQGRQFYAEGRRVYESRIVQSLMKKDPELIAKSIHPGESTNVEMVKKALLGHGQNAAAWNTFRRQYIQSNLLGGSSKPLAGGIFSLKERLSLAGNEQLNAIFGDDATGKTALRDLSLIAEAASRVQPIRQHTIARIIESAAPVAALFRPEAAAAELAGIEVGPAIMAKVIYSPTATRLLVRGIDISGENAGMAAVNISRAMDIALRFNDKQKVDVDTSLLRRPNGTQKNQVSAR